MAKKICWGLFAAVVILMGVRIIFVNVTYPDAVFKNVKESSELLYRDCRISIGDTTYIESEKLVPLNIYNLYI